MTTIKINVYRDAGMWFGARWIDGEYDGCDALDIEGTATAGEAIEAAETMPLAVDGDRLVLGPLTDSDWSLVKEVTGQGAATIRINGVETPVPSEAIAYKYADPTEDARWVFDEADLAEIRAADPSLLVVVA